MAVKIQHHSLSDVDAAKATATTATTALTGSDGAARNDAAVTSNDTAISAAATTATATDGNIC